MLIRQLSEYNLPPFTPHIHVALKPDLPYFSYDTNCEPQDTPRPSPSIQDISTLVPSGISIVFFIHSPRLSITGCISTKFRCRAGGRERYRSLTSTCSGVRGWSWRRCSGFQGEEERRMPLFGIGFCECFHGEWAGPAARTIRCHLDVVRRLLTCA